MYKVLLVDDEEMVTQGLSRFVQWEQLGYIVSGTATSVDKALSFLEKEHIDLVITDITMPVKSGLDLIEALNEKYPNIKAVILSGYSEFSYAQQAIRLGAMDYLTKPINFNSIRVLLERIKLILDEQTARSGTDDTLKQILTNSMIMNICNGLPFEKSKVSSYLDTACPITAIRISCIDKHSLPEYIYEELSHSLGECKVVSPTENEILCILEGERNQNEVIQAMENLVSMASVGGVNLGIGISEQFNGYLDLRMASLQAAKAMRYQRARNNSGVTFFKLMREMYLNTKESEEDQIVNLISLISTPETRTTLIDDFLSTLSAIETKADFTLTMAQQFCTELLIELDTPIQNLFSDDYPHHTYLSETLMDVLSARDISEIQNSMVVYFEKILNDLSRLDESKNDVELIDRVKKYIQKHFAENLTLSVLSETFFVCPAYLSRLFKKKTGINFVDYLTNLRIEKSKDFLANPNMKIYIIAEMVGYENPRYFSRIFKEVTGISPQEYRNNTCNENSEV